MEEFKGRDVAFVSDWLTKKVFKRSLLEIGGADDDGSLVGYDRQIRRQGTGVGHLNTIFARHWIYKQPPAGNMCSQGLAENLTTFVGQRSSYNPRSSDNISLVTFHMILGALPIHIGGIYTHLIVQRANKGKFERWK